METLKDLVEEAKRRTILVAVLVISTAYLMSWGRPLVSNFLTILLTGSFVSSITGVFNIPFLSSIHLIILRPLPLNHVTMFKVSTRPQGRGEFLTLSVECGDTVTSGSVWINVPVAIILLAVIRRLSFQIDVRWKPRNPEVAPPPHPQHRQLTIHDPLLSGPSRWAGNRWRRKIDSPVVEAAVDELTRCVVNEWVTDLWYSSVTPDEDVPEELRILVNGVIAEVAQRARRVNLITLLSRDMVDLVGTHFELYRRMKVKIGPAIMESLSTEERDEKLKAAMMTSRELHPALLSPEAEYKVLKRLTGGVVALVLNRQDAPCRLLRSLARELLACAVLQPVLNFASPGFINELIETLASATNEKVRQANQEQADAPNGRQRTPDCILARKPSLSGLEMMALSTTKPSEGVPEIMSHAQPSSIGQPSALAEDIDQSTKTPLSIDTKSSKEAHLAKTEHVGLDKQEDWGAIPRGDWAQVLDAVTQRRKEALTPEHLDNLWAKGRNYKKRESKKPATLGITIQNSQDPARKFTPAALEETKVSVIKPTSGKEVLTTRTTELVQLSVPSFSRTSERSAMDIPSPQRDYKSASEQYGALLFGDPGEGEEDQPGIGFSPLQTSSSHSIPLNSSRDQASRNSPESVSPPNEDSQDHSKNGQSNTGIAGKSSTSSKNFPKSGSGSQRLKRAVRLLSHRKSRSTGSGSDGWQELGGRSQEGIITLLNAGEGPTGERTKLGSQKTEEISKNPKSEDGSSSSLRIDTDAPTTGLTSHVSMLQCRVIGAHFEKVGSKAFAVYSIRVKDADNLRWTVQRRFRNFEQLHRCLKDMRYYSLNLPPKRFLSSSLDNNFVRERCILLDKYLKDLLAIPSVAELHEVWDFLSVNSEHYAPARSPSVMKTLAVNVDDAVDDMFRQIRGVSDDISGVLKTATSGIRQRFPLGSGDISQAVAVATSAEITTPTTPGSSMLKLSGPSQTLLLTDSGFGEKALANSVSEDEYGGLTEESAQGLGSVNWHSESDLQVDSHEPQGFKTSTHTFGSGHLDMPDNRYFGTQLERALSEGHSPVESLASDVVEDDLAIPQEWTPPKVSVPLLNLVDLIFQLQGRGWIRRQVLWMAKQILQLGIGDAIDDWLLGKIQWLRKEEVVASGIHWVKGMLWTDGVFLTKQGAAGSGIPRRLSIEFEKGGEQWQQRPPIGSFEYRLEAARRAGIVREILLDKAPSPLVSLIGKKQYTRCAKDIYYFSQSTVCLKQVAYSLLEMLLLAAFPELQDLILDIRSSVV